MRGPYRDRCARGRRTHAPDRQVRLTSDHEARRRTANALADRPVGLPRVRAPDRARAARTRRGPARLDPQVELIRRKGMEHERGLPRRAARRRARRPRDRARGRRLGRAPVAATEQAIRDGVDVVYQGVFANGRWRGHRRLPRAAGRTAPTRRSTRSSRGTRSRPTSSSSASTASSSRGSRGASRSGSTSCSARGSASRSGPRSSAPTTGACARGSSGSSPTRRRPSRGPNDHCGVCDFKPVCDEHWDAVDHLCRVAGIRRAQIEKLIAAEDRDARRARPRRAPSRRPGSRRDLREAPRSRPSSSSGAASTGATATSCSSRSPGVGFALLPEPDAGDLFFDFEGNPFWDPTGGLEYLWGILDADRALHAAARARPRRASARRSSSSSTSSTRACASTPACTSTTTPSTRSPRSSG